MDAQHFDANVVAQIDTIRRIGRRRLRMSSELDDFTQEVVIRLYANRDQLRDEDRLAHWAAVSAKNLAIQWNRKRAPVLMSSMPDMLFAHGADDPTLRAERWQALVNALSALDEVERDLLVSYYVDEVAYSELQERHGLSYSAVGVRLHRAKRKLRKQLGWLVVAIAAFFRAPQHRAFGAQPMTTSRMSMVFIAGVATTITGAVIFGWAMSGTAEATPDTTDAAVIAVESAAVTDDDSGTREYTEDRRDTDDFVDDDRPRASTEDSEGGDEDRESRYADDDDRHTANAWDDIPGVDREAHPLVHDESATYDQVYEAYPLFKDDNHSDEEMRAAYPGLYTTEGKPRLRPGVAEMFIRVQRAAGLLD